MNYLHYDLQAGPSDLVEVTLDRAANVMLLTPSDYDAYRTGRTFHYHGGHVTQSPYRIRPPHQGSWYVVIDLGGYVGTVRASCQVIKG